MIEEAYQDAKQGRYSRTPMIEMTIPSSLDPTLAPPGHHVCLLFTQYAPYHLQDGQWDDKTKEDYANIVFESIERQVLLYIYRMVLMIISFKRYAPGFKESIVGKEVLPPPDLEAIFGLTGGKLSVRHTSLNKKKHVCQTF